MALEAQQIYLATLQQAGVGRAVRGMASNATFNDSVVLINKRPLLVRVALIADNILPRAGRPQLPSEKTSVLIMAIRAFQQPFIHLVMESPRELLLRLEMAAVTKLWLLLL